MTEGPESEKTSDSEAVVQAEAGPRRLEYQVQELDHSNVDDSLLCGFSGVGNSKLGL